MRLQLTMHQSRLVSTRHTARYRLAAPLSLGFALLALAAPSLAQVVDLDLRTTLFYEPSSSSELVVLTPAASLGVTATETFTVRGGYEADIVSGATEAVKSGPLAPDVISGATNFDDVRHVGSFGFTINRENTHLGAGFSYGVENDYRSRAITVIAGTDFLQRNTEIELAYARGFDEVCTTGYRTSDSPTIRSALDSSAGCFSSADNRAARDIDLHNLQAAWTQSWTPVLATQLVLSGSIQHGFLENPYRSVIIGPAGDQALENHPDNRARAAIALRVKYYVRSLETAFAVGVRGYRDTWDILSQTYELSAERYVLSGLRLMVRARFYDQSGALFWSDDYTGGEPALGLRGQYWSGDRELSPLRSYLLGARLRAGFQGRPGDRVAGMLLDLSASVGLDVIKTDLQEFTWGGIEPDDTIAIAPTVGLSGTF